jgi:molybdopterin molybdotransferase
MFKKRNNADEARKLFLNSFSSLLEIRFCPSKAGILISVSKADGFVILPENVEGFNSREEVEVVLNE